MSAELREQDITYHRCDKFLLKEQEDSRGYIKCVKGSYMNGVYDPVQDVFYCEECWNKIKGVPERV